MLVQFAFFGAYSIGALIYYLISHVIRRPHQPDRLQERRHHWAADLGGRQRVVLSRGEHRIPIPCSFCALFIVGSAWRCCKSRPIPT